jgi:predicted amidohydrolase
VYRTIVLVFLYLGMNSCSASRAVKIDSLNNSTSQLVDSESSRNSASRLVESDGLYKNKPLEKDIITLKVIQSAAKTPRPLSPAKEIINENLNHIIDLAKKACNEGDKPDIMLFHEFPLTGYVSGNRDQVLAASINIPGAETAKLSEIAKQCNTYLIFGSYAKDPEWKGHILSLNTVIDRQGKIVEKFWKTKNIKRSFFFPKNFEIMTTTIEGVRDKFREKYGIEKEYPIVRTELGNIAVSTVQHDPFVFAAFAMKGAEIILRTSTVFSKHDVIETAVTNNVYSAMANISLDSEGGGGSMIVDPTGKVMAELKGNKTEGFITAKIPIAELRKNRKLPQYSTEVTAPVMNQYVQEIPVNHMNLPEKSLPKTAAEMKELLDKNSRWKK